MKKHGTYLHTLAWSLVLAAIGGGFWAWLFLHGGGALASASVVPFLMLLWVRSEFREILVKRAREVLAATGIVAVCGALVLLVCKLALFENIAWWLLASFLFASFGTLTHHYERLGVDFVVRELRALGKSFENAGNGVRLVTRERNFTIHAAAAAAVLIAGFFVSLAPVEWGLLLVAIALVFCSEFINFALERHVDALVNHHDENARHIKDAAAAGVLIATIVAVLIGALVFMPHLL